MKHLAINLFFLFSTFFAFSQEIEIQVDEITSTDYTIYSTKPVYFYGNFYLTFLNHQNLSLSLVNMNEKTGVWEFITRSTLPFSSEEGKLLFAIWDDENGKKVREVFKYNINTKSNKKITNGNTLFNEIQNCQGYFFYYQNGTYYFALMTAGYEEASYNLGIYDEKTGKIVKTDNVNIPLSLSPDKLHMILGNGSVMRLPEQEIVYNRNEDDYLWDFTPYGSIDRRSAISFITNEILIGLRKPNGGNVRALYSLSGSHIADIQFIIPNSKKLLNMQLSFSPDLTRAIASYTENGKMTGFSLLDTTSFRDYLDSKNLLFRTTTAVSTESRVRVRENPNLEAQTFGHLEPGDELEVTDRSGIKVQIGDMNDWWYRIRRKSDGLTGWAYGAFLKLASYQGELGPRPEKDLR